MFLFGDLALRLCRNRSPLQVDGGLLILILLLGLELCIRNEPFAQIDGFRRRAANVGRFKRD